MNISLYAIEFDNYTKVETNELLNQCFVWKDKEDKLLEKKFTINDKYIITTFICGEEDEAFGWLSPDGPDPKKIIGTNGIEITKECNDFFHDWNDDKKIQFLNIKNLSNNEELIVCGWEYADGYFVINQDITDSKNFLEIKFKGVTHEYHIFLLENFSAEPVIFNYSKSSYTLKTKNGVIELQGGEEYNLSEILEEHFNIQLEDKNITFVPWI